MLIEIFQKVNPTINYAHKGHRTSSERLFERFGIDKTFETAKYAVSLSGAQYAPVITTPTALENKLGDLIAYYKKNNTSNTVNL